MCGISGLFGRSSNHFITSIRKMSDAIRHRGPDDEGFVLVNSQGAHYYGGAETQRSCYSSGLRYAPILDIEEVGNKEIHVAMAHRRLSIVDLSFVSHQPMCTLDGKKIIVYNGEIYNYIELRDALIQRGHSFISKGDAEVILHAYTEWGLECLSKFNGMFAFIIYNVKDNNIFFARDRFGIKPLYYWLSPSGFLAIGSEIKQFTSLPSWIPQLNIQRAYDYLNWGLTDHTNETMFNNVMQLPGGHCVKVGLDGIEQGFDAIKWYELRPSSFDMSFDNAAETFKELFDDSIRLRLRADVPVGTGLSGGLDSSSIVCSINEIFQNSGCHDLQNTFSSCSELELFDERPFIEDVIRATKVKSHYSYPALDRLFDDLGMITWHQDEPFGSTSIYAEWNIFKTVATTSVKVTLDGHGADELLAGYHTFFGPYYVGLLRRLQLLDVISEIRASRKLHGYSVLFALRSMLSVMIPGILRRPLRRVTARNLNDPPWLNLKRYGINVYDLYYELSPHCYSIRDYSIAQLLYTNLPLQLHWSDRDSMAHSIESRMPFLDYRLVEFVLGCTDSYKVEHGVTKRMLRHAMKSRLPEKIHNRRDKMGFVTPEEVWARDIEPMQFVTAVENAVDSSCGILNAEAIKKAKRIIYREEPYDTALWRMINFGVWMNCFSITNPYN